MDIKDKVSPGDKQQVGELIIECQVLARLLKQKEAVLQSKVGEILAKEGLSPQLYNLKFNIPENKWEAQLRPDALALPNREMRRTGRHN